MHLLKEAITFHGVLHDKSEFVCDDVPAILDLARLLTHSMFLYFTISNIMNSY